MGKKKSFQRERSRNPAATAEPIPLVLADIKSATETIAPQFLRHLSRSGGLRTFIETGTFYGETTAAAAAIFNCVHTIELSPELHALAVERFANNAAVHVHRGESDQRLREILPGVKEPTLFWLDAHYSELNTARGRTNTPIEAELHALAAANVRDALILIDDLRCFQPAGPATRESLRGYPSVNEVRDLVLRIDPAAQFVVFGDIAIAAIGTVRIAPSELLSAVTISRCFEDGDANPEQVLAAESAIARCSTAERDVLAALAGEFKPSEQFGLGGHYRLWRALIRQHDGHIEQAREDFATALTLGCNHRRVFDYLQSTEPVAGVSVTDMATTGEDRVLQRCLEPGAVVFDIGAHLGDWARAALNVCPALDLHLFEPSPITFQRLNDTFVANKSARCVMNESALGNQNGSIKFCHYLDAPAWSTSYRRFDAEQQYAKRPPLETEVAVETLDSYAARHRIAHIDFLKIDVEGAEYDVLTGASDFLRRGAIAYVQFEYGGTFADAGISLRLVYALLRRHAYAVFRIAGNGFSPIAEFSDDLEDYEYSNFLAVNERLVDRFTGAAPRMLDLPRLFEQHGVKPAGVIHIGAHEGREANAYAAMGVDSMLFIEANPAVHRTLEANLADFPNARALNVAVSETTGTVDLHVTSMDQSSSILPLARHLDIYPTITPTGSVSVSCYRLDDLLAAHDLNAQDFNMLNLDIQGAELMALRGAEKTLAHIDAINTEVNYAELYRGGARIDELDAFLDSHGFTRVATTTPFHPTWGDALYVRKPIIAMSSFGENGRFANQIFQYAFTRIQARQFGCRVSLPDWVGRTLFGLTDECLDTAHLPERRQTLDQNLLSCPILNNGQALRDVDLWGYFQYHTRYYAPYKDYFRALFEPVAPLRERLDNALDTVLAGERTLVCLHLRRGDYGYHIFYITPAEWYRRWLARIWPTLHNPVLYIASDEPAVVLPEFADYAPLTAADLGVDVAGAEFYPDFYVLSRGDYVAISNSSFSFAACMLNAGARGFVRPDLNIGRLVDFDPWDAEPLQRDARAENFGPPYLAPTTASPAESSVAVRSAASQLPDPQTPRVSVYITSYNQCAWLAEAIDSILAQSVAAFEIIIVDDASTDGSVALIQDYCERYPELIKPVFHATNRGIAHSRNAALATVRGDYVTYLDGDDRFLPNKLECELATLAQNPDAQIVYSNFYFIDAAGTRTDVWAGDDDIVHEGWIFPFVFARDFPKRTLFRNELVSYAHLQRTGFHDPALALFEDFELRIRASFDSRVAYCDHILTEYRQHAGGASQRQRSIHLRALDYIYNKHVALLAVLRPPHRDDAQRAYIAWVAEHFVPAVERELAAPASPAAHAPEQGENLAVIVGLPHAGGDDLSTALNRFATVNVIDPPGALLPLLEIWNDDDAIPARQGFKHVVEQIEGGETLYMSGVRDLAQSLYDAALPPDRTGLIIEHNAEYLQYFSHIRETFPRAQFVFVLRHPGAIFNAMIDSARSDASSDGAPMAMSQGLAASCTQISECLVALGCEAIIVRHEDLLEQPLATLRHVCARLRVRADLKAISKIAASFNDKPAHKAGASDAWINHLNERGCADAAMAFFNVAGESTISRLGYSVAPAIEHFSEKSAADNGLTIARA